MGFFVFTLFLLAGCFASTQECDIASNDKKIVDAHSYLAGIMPTRQLIDQWLTGNKPLAIKFDAELGWLKLDKRVRRKDGCDIIYTYGSYDERKTIYYADRPCRINTYGDSFTQCAQVSDGETWQEMLAAHIGEPVRNFGIGGYSVYQAYLRMLREEARIPADYIIFNIYSDDHYRNLEAWWSIRWKKKGEFAKFPGMTLPYLKVDLKTGECAPQPNLFKNKKDLYKLCDIDYLVEHFKDDFTLSIMLEHINSGKDKTLKARQKYGKKYSPDGIVTTFDRINTHRLTAQEKHTKAALLASMKVVEWIEEFARNHNKKVLYVLSYSYGELAKKIRKGDRFDQSFVDFLENKNLPYIDLMKAHEADYVKFSIDIKQYLDRYYIGHYNPRGNFFTANAIKDKLVEMLNPKPSDYHK
ncbi:MAG: SGNH/GDSL hydrolase family protein [Planctomycetota bacterium]